MRGHTPRRPPRAALRALTGLTLVCLLAACGRKTNDGETGNGDPVCPSPLTGAEQAIVNGAPTWDASVVHLSAGQALSIGAILTASRQGVWSNTCTGTLVAADVVLTAAHCVVRRSGATMDPARVRFSVGEDASEGLWFDVTAVHAHPDYDDRSGRHDVALLILEDDVVAAVPGLVPLAYHCDALDASVLEGDVVQTVGFGCVDSDCAEENWHRWWSVQAVVAVSTFDFVVDGYGESGVCYGDSGGPALWTVPGEGVRILGVLSWGDAICGNQDHFASAHDSCAFVDAHTGGPWGPDPDPGPAPDPEPEPGPDPQPEPDPDPEPDPC